MLDIPEEPRWGPSGRIPLRGNGARRPTRRSHGALLPGRPIQGRDARRRERRGVRRALRRLRTGRGGRDYETVQAGENTFRNLHLRPFRAAVRTGCATVLAAFTDVDGVAMHAHRRLLREVLKDEWGFDRVVVGDWDGVGQLVNQGVTIDLRDAAVKAIEMSLTLDRNLGPIDMACSGRRRCRGRGRRGGRWRNRGWRGTR